MRTLLKPFYRKRSRFSAIIKEVHGSKGSEKRVLLVHVCQNTHCVAEHAWVYVPSFHPLASSEGKRVRFSAKVNLYFKKDWDRRLLADYCLEEIRDVVLLSDSRQEAKGEAADGHII